jgi:phenylpyruvate tautomerase PptA (4-oxalocrotonate tautomerase family)|tara:strand:+ start:8214 stop:8582 length:369 start_codon:yes stop_codon:yes gene_type:complete
MPLVNISILKGTSVKHAKAIASGVNSAVIETMGFPADDLYQIIHEVQPHCLQFQKRSKDRVMIQLIMRAGRSDESKQNFYAKVAQNLSKNPGIDPANVLITIAENRDIDWSFRDGIAQFIAS